MPVLMTVALIGFGEAARTFAIAGGWGGEARAYDIKTNDPAQRATKMAAYADAGVTGCASNEEALSGAASVLSLVTADQALAVAQNISASHHGIFYFDMNSVAPDTKRAARDLLAPKDIRYVDVAIMSPVDPLAVDAPLLVSGEHAEAGAGELDKLGFTNVRVVGNEVGQASAIKMIRSVMIKGIEALTAEMMLAARAANVEADVLASLGEDWTRRAAYNLERMQTHGLRRAAEMEESAKTLTALGVDPVMTRGTIIRQREMAA